MKNTFKITSRSITMDKLPLSYNEALKLYYEMLRIRLTEQRIAGLLYKHEIGCPVHLYVGQEAIAVGVCQNLTSDDFVFSTHRSHGHYLQWEEIYKSCLQNFMARLQDARAGKGALCILLPGKQGLWEAPLRSDHQYRMPLEPRWQPN